MPDYVRTYIDKIDTILKAGFNAKLREIDPGLQILTDAQIFKSKQLFKQNRPLIEQYVFNQSDYQGLITNGATITWSHFTGVNIYDNNPPESAGNIIHVYVEALMKTIYEGESDPGTLDNVVCRIVPLSILNQVAEGDDNILSIEGGILWEVEQDIDLLE